MNPQNYFSSAGGGESTATDDCLIFWFAFVCSLQVLSIYIYYVCKLYHIVSVYAHHFEVTYIKL